jgi:hypothetical protein
MEHIPLRLELHQLEEQAHSLQVILLRNPQEVVSFVLFFFVALEEDNLLLRCILLVTALHAFLGHLHDLLELLVRDCFVASVQRLLLQENLDFFLKLFKALALLQYNVLFEEFLSGLQHFLHSVLDLGADLDLVLKKVLEIFYLELWGFHGSSDAFASKLELSGRNLDLSTYNCQMAHRVVDFQAVPELELLLQSLLGFFDHFFATCARLDKGREHGDPAFGLGPHYIGVVAKSKQELLESVAFALKLVKFEVFLLNRQGVLDQIRLRDDFSIRNLLLLCHLESKLILSQLGSRSNKLGEFAPLASVDWEL